jgi:hypothetical protein
VEGDFHPPNSKGVDLAIAAWFSTAKQKLERYDKLKVQLNVFLIFERLLL